MGFKLSLVLGGLLLVSVGGSLWYIDRLLDQISVLKANQMTLETKISEQNESIKNYLNKQEQTQAQLTELNRKNQESQREVQKLRNTFAKHDLDNLAIAKPKLIENIINKGTKKVNAELIALTDPKQFDEENTTN